MIYCFAFFDRINRRAHEAASWSLSLFVVPEAVLTSFVWLLPDAGMISGPELFIPRKSLSVRLFFETCMLLLPDAFV